MLQIVQGQEIRNLEYWDLCYGPDEEDRGEEYYVERLRELLKEAIARRLVADVPIGFYISGGLDSSVVACYIGKFLLNSYYSFSAEIGSGDLDESRFQKIIKDYVRSEHYSTKVAEQALIYLAFLSRHLALLHIAEKIQHISHIAAENSSDPCSVSTALAGDCLTRALSRYAATS